MDNRMFVLMGKSSSGKDTIYNGVIKYLNEIGYWDKYNLSKLVIDTTRPMRSGEVEGREYFFKDEAYLEEERNKGNIIEERCYQTAMGPWYYFTHKDNLNFNEFNYFGINTLEGLKKYYEFYDRGLLVPFYLYVDEITRIERALAREKSLANPQITEMCRRYIADELDYSEENLSYVPELIRFKNDDLDTTVIKVSNEIIRQLKK